MVPFSALMLPLIANTLVKVDVSNDFMPIRALYSDLGSIDEGWFDLADSPR